MIDIMLSVIVFILLILCAFYVVKEFIRRMKQKQDNNHLETNWDIRGAIGAWIFGSAVIIGFTIAHYAQAPSQYYYMLCCVLGVIALAIAYFFAFNKIIINKETGGMVAYGIIRRKKFNVNDITIIKHTFETWKVYSNKRKLFAVGNRYHNSPSEFYIYIRKESGCEEKHPKGHIGRDLN